MTEIIKKNNPVKQTRTMILDVSAKLFSQYGYNGTVIRDIAQALNMKAGSLYYHFDSKEQLVLEVLTIGIENIIDTVQREVAALPKNCSSKEIVQAATKGHLLALLEKGDYTSTSIRNLGQLPEPVQAEVLVIRDRYEDMWRKWLLDAQTNGEIKANVNLKVLRLSILGVLNRTLAWYKKGELTIEEIAGMQIGYFWDGVSA
ncbi:MAG: TetR family transcriptional regulator [Cycloclasticus sp.]|nr:MAG: TetR family transcriptional regulator [Cycloclasticus sp.]